MDEKKVKYGPSEFLINNRNFFQNYSFNFEGLSLEHERGFTEIVTELGGKVSNEAKYTFVEKSYFEKVKNKKQKDFFNLNFFLDSVNFGKVLNIQLYRCDKTFDDFNDNSHIIKNNLDTESSSSNESEKINQEINSTDYFEDSDSTSRSDKASELSLKKRKNKESDLTLKTNLQKRVLQNKTNSKVEERQDLKWLFRLDENNLCKMQNCTYEPGPHESHSKAGRVISVEEKIVILKYLIKNNLIPKAKGSTTWKVMHSNGYLTHRSPETLRNCMRRIMIPNIKKYGIPDDILLQFLQIERK